MIFKRRRKPAPPLCEQDLVVHIFSAFFPMTPVVRDVLPPQPRATGPRHPPARSGPVAGRRVPYSALKSPAEVDAEPDWRTSLPEHVVTCASGCRPTAGARQSLKNENRLGEFTC